MTGQKSFSEIWPEYLRGKKRMMDVINVQKIVDGEVEMITREMLLSLDRKDWEAAQALVILMNKRPSPAYREILCEVLERNSTDMVMDDIVEALWEIADETCVPVLEMVAMTRHPDDDYMKINERALDLIYKIDCPRSWASLKNIAEHGPDGIRKKAQDLL